jgi:thiosulfate/3-mercaptopyruvate sulfurtransferase
MNIDGAVCLGHSQVKRLGHVRHAISLPHNELFTTGGYLKPEHELRAAFDAAGVDLKRPISAYCGSGTAPVCSWLHHLR